MPGRLEGKVCVITGAASGIGAETARLFAEEGATCGRRRPRAEGAEGELALEADVTDEEQVRGMYGRADEEFGRIDVLFNNAGINPPEDERCSTPTVEAWQRVQDVNVRSVFLCCKHGIPHLLEARRRIGHQHRLVRRRDGRGDLADLLHRVQGRGAVHVARDGGRVRPPRACASTPSARARSTPRCCRSCSPRTRRRPPGGWCTCRWAGSPRPGRSPTAALFLASDESSYVTASTFLVDGGLSGAYVTPE